MYIGNKWYQIFGVDRAGDPLGMTDTQIYCKGPYIMIKNVPRQGGPEESITKSGHVRTMREGVYDN